MLVSVVIPCYNSQATIGKVVDLVTEAMPASSSWSTITPGTGLSV